MTLPDIFSTKGRSGNKVRQNTFKTTPKDDFDTFCDIISHLTSKYRPDFFGTSKFAEPDRTLTNPYDSLN
jgi:hypothetical protein